MRLRTVLLAHVFISTVTVTKGQSKTWFRMWFTLGSPGSPYSSERIPEMRTFVGNCRADVGRCPVGSCSIKPYSFCPHDGYICPETETRVKRCDFGVYKYEYVTKCVCCKDNGIVVKGIVQDAVTNEPLDRITILVSGWFVTYSSGDGTFKSSTKSNIRSIVVRANDKNENYMDAVKIVDIAEGFRGPVEVKLLMLKKANPVTIVSTVDTVLSLSSDPLNPTSGNTVIEIKANSFRIRSGLPYNGQVNASVTFIDPLKEPEAVMPGRFLTLNENTLEPLITDGIVSFNFKSTDGSSLRLSEPVKFIMRERMNVWVLNTITGLWETPRGNPRRGKRQVSIEDILSIETDRWYNIDKIPGAPRCYFKGRIFNETSGVEITSSTTASFRPRVIAYTYLEQRLRLYPGDTNAPNNTCFEVRCPVVSNPNNSLAGFINMSATEVISIGGIQLPSITYLTPRKFSDYDATITSSLSDVQYTIAPNDLDIFVNFVSHTSGPFYTDKSICESSTVSQPAFHFLKPELPSYLPVPDNTEICTARIAFRYFTAHSTNLPNVTGISVWQQNGSDYYYTDVAQMSNVSVGNVSIITVCLKYRCSQENDSTTVYMDIDISTVNVTYNFTHRNGSVMIYTDSRQEFYCYGNLPRPSVSTIEGLFIAPVNVGSGPAFYGSETNDCRQESNSTTFAYEFTCAPGEGVPPRPGVPPGQEVPPGQGVPLS